MFRILVTGSRDWPKPFSVYTYLGTAIVDNGMPMDVTIIHGGAKGADQFAGEFARQWVYDEEVYPANWKGLGKRAGYARNAEMVAAGADICLAFIKNNSRGATMCAKLAEDAGIPVTYVREDSEPVEE